MGIKFANGGFLTTVQDMGRIGYQESVMSVSGVMDQRSAASEELGDLQDARRGRSLVQRAEAPWQPLVSPFSLPASSRLRGFPGPHEEPEQTHSEYWIQWQL